MLEFLEKYKDSGALDEIILSHKIIQNMKQIKNFEITVGLGLMKGL